MPANARDARLCSARDADASALDGLLMSRVVCEGGATRAEVVRDLAPIVSHKLSPAEWRSAAEDAMSAILAAGWATESRGRLTATQTGVAAAARFLRTSEVAGREWQEQRDTTLIARGLGMEATGGGRLKALATHDGLRTLIVQQAFGLKGKKNTAPAKLRAQLAMVALERAFGNKIQAGFGKGSSLSSKAGRLLAGQLSKAPRDFGTDTKLIAYLAAEYVDAVQADADALRAAILKMLGTRLLESHSRAVSSQVPAPTAKAPQAALAPAANDAEPPQRQSPFVRPGIESFADTVRETAEPLAQGWPGNRKAYISQVWEAIRESHAAWGLSEIEFKCMLAEAHRCGALALANADLKDKKSLAEIERSATLYKNTVWHFVRVD